MNDPRNSYFGRPKTQKEEILFLIQTRGCITRASAADAHIYELSSRIGELQDDGWIFDRETLNGRNVHGRAWRYTRYSNARQCASSL